MTNNKAGIIALLTGTIFFLLFAYDIENDRDFWTWVWLLNSILNFLNSLILFIKADRE